MFILTLFNQMRNHFLGQARRNGKTNPQKTAFPKGGAPGRPVAVTASLLYFLVPFVFFYDRMIMPDGLLTTLGIWTMIFCLWVVRQRHIGWAFAAGLVICLASLTKLSGLAYLVIPLAAFILFKPSSRSWKIPT